MTFLVLAKNETDIRNKLENAERNARVCTSLCRTVKQSAGTGFRGDAVCDAACDTDTGYGGGQFAS